MKLELQLHGLEGVLATLKSLPPEVVSKNGGPCRVALRKGAMVILKQARANFIAAVALPGKTGITDTTGFTEKRIIAKRKSPRGGEPGERYIITVRPDEHPSKGAIRRKSRSTGKRKARPIKQRFIKANDIAFIMEHGSVKQPATPWLVPAFKTKAEEAIRTVEKELVKEIAKVVKKLAAQNQGR